MIEQKVDIDDLRMVDIEMDIFLYYWNIQSTFEYIFHKRNIDKLNTNVVSIKDIDKLDKSIHQEQDIIFFY